ncbi:type IV secretion system protein [Pseudomonas amygdali pv. morsprunorum]|uniref:type IV secretion system protein n=1 Tax=Pseudomonas amygdali TaxID=47877 RepID=UPI00288E4D39|nr:type IV secretion system protein [Pseudomonas amygdali]MDT3268702.1 type IV secretion system protein [Pseudomonas amygdali pv. morsprunorum]
MKKTIALCAVLFTGSAYAVYGIPVADNPAATKRVVEWAQLMKQWGQTVQQYKKELTAYKDQLATSTGVRAIGEFLDEAKKIKNEAVSVVNDVQEAQSALTSIYGLTQGEYAALANKYGLMDSCKGLSLQMLNSCQGSITSKLNLIERAENVSDSFSRKLTSIQRLADRAANSKDSKESQDLANAVNLKAVEMNALQLQWSMATEQAKAANVVWEEKKTAAFREKQSSAPIPTFD